MQDRHYGVWPKGLPHRLPPVTGSVYDNLVRSAEAAPHRDAIVYYGRSLSFAEVHAQVQQMAGYLASVGIGADDRVVLWMQNSPQFVIGYYAILAANAVVVPLNPMCRSDELTHVVQDSGAKAVLHGAELTPILQGSACADLPAVSACYADYIDPGTDLPLPSVVRDPVPETSGTSWAQALASGHPAPTHTRDPQDWALIPYSSGTTGRPKGCLHTHASVGAVIQAYPLWIGMDPGSRSLASLPFCHVTGMQHSMNLPIYTGSTIYLMTRWDAQLAARLIPEARIQHWRSITTMMVDFLSLPGVEDLDVSSLISVGGGGAQMPKALAEKMQRLIGLDYVEAYGLSETMAPTHINPLQAPKPQCLGIPIFDVDSRIIDPATGAELPPGEVGEIVTHAPQVMQGYWQRPEETSEAFLQIDGKSFLRTGDIGYMDDQGYFFFTDRLKRMINVGGLKVWPAEVEAILHGHEALQEACVVGDPDPRLGEVVRAVVVPREGRTVPEPDALTQWCKSRMATYKVPQRFEARTALPRSVAGKVLWKEL